MKKLTLPVKLFLISEILIFLMIVGVVLTEIIFPLPASIEYRLIEENQKWSPRFWDNVVSVFCNIVSILIFFLSIIEITVTIKNYQPDKSLIKEIFTLFFIFLSIIAYICFFREIILGITIILLLIFAVNSLAHIKMFRQKKASVKEIIMFIIMIFNFVVFGFLECIFILGILFHLP